MEFGDVGKCENGAIQYIGVGGLSKRQTTRQRLEAQLNAAREVVENLVAAIEALDANPGAENLLDKLSRVNY